MKKIILILSSIVIFTAAFAKSNTTFGEAAYKSKPKTLNQMMLKFKQGQKNLGVVQGKVVKLCEKKGCWLELKDATASVRVLMKDYGFTLPQSVKGKTVLVEGELIQKMQSKSALKHYMKDEGLSSKQIAQKLKTIPKAGKKVFQFVASGIKQI